MASSPLNNTISSSHWKKMLRRGAKAKANARTITTTMTIAEEEDFSSQNQSPLIQRTPTRLPVTLRPRWPPPPSLAGAPWPLLRPLSAAISAVLGSLLPTCHRPSLPSPRRRSSRRRSCLTCTLFGSRRGRVTFAVQEDPSGAPALLLELAFPTSQLVQEMASGAVRILLECEKLHAGDTGGKKQRELQLWEEPVWTMYCNGRRTGYAVSRQWADGDRQVFEGVRPVSAGAGVIPTDSPAHPLSVASAGKIHGVGGEADGLSEIMYMRAKFERVVASKDSEAFYMMSPDGGGGGPELSIFLLRL